MNLVSLAVLAILAAAEEPSTPPSAVDQLFASVQKDGPIELPEAARNELVKVLPARGRGQECEKPTQVHETAVALKDRGDGTLLVAILSSCNGEVAFAFAPGTPLRVAKLFELEESKKLVGALSLKLRGGNNDEVGLVLASAQSSELRFYVRRTERGFAFAPSGTLPGFASTHQCDEHDSDHLAGWQSLLLVPEARRLLRLRLDARCGGGLSAARCEIWHLEQGQLDKRGVCALPQTFDPEELRKAGWR